jgi:hypothetical protein
MLHEWEDPEEHKRRRRQRVVCVVCVICIICVFDFPHDTAAAATLSDVDEPYLDFIVLAIRISGYFFFCPFECGSN